MRVVPSPLMSDQLEPIRRLVKRFLFALAANDINRYLKLRSKIADFLYWAGLYEQANLSSLREFIKPGDTVVDVGASFGIYTRELLKLVGPKGKVYAFEPLKEVFNLLSAKVPASLNLHLVNAALGSEACAALSIKVPLISGGIPEPALATLGDPGLNYSEETVKVMRLDDLICDLSGLTFIKVDVEGKEMDFLQGARESIIKFRPVVQFELNDPGRLPEFQSFAQTLGYSAVSPSPGSINYYLIPNKKS